MSRSYDGLFLPIIVFRMGRPPFWGFADAPDALGGGPMVAATQQQAVPDIERMMHQYGDYLLRTAFTYLKDYQAAEDAVQETFINVYRHYGGFRGECSEKTWITRIAINICKTMLRKQKPMPPDTLEALENLPDDNGEAFDEDQNQLMAAVMDLPQKYKDVVMMFYYQDLNTYEIARILNISENGVSSRLSRARAMLKQSVERSSEQ